MDPNVARSLLETGNEINDILRNQERLSRYFNKDEGNRFHMEGVIGAGVVGVAWKIKYTASPTDIPIGPNPRSSQPGPGLGPSVRHIVLKTDRLYSDLEDEIENDDGDDGDDDEDDEEESDRGESSIPNERVWLEVLRWAKHVVSSVSLTNDPLDREFTGIASHQMEPNHWVYIEWLENGTLYKLVDRAGKKKIRLPNRVLWRLFLCLLRMCIAMGWPPKKPDGINPQPVLETSQGTPYGGIIHGDMHHNNLMFGDFIPEDPDMEHTLTPILKLIDLGSTRKVVDFREENIKAVRENLFDIGIMMVELITLDPDLADCLFPGASGAKAFRLKQNGPEIMTNGGPLLPDENNVNPYPWLDTGLRDLVCACMATDVDKRPPPQSMANVAMACIKNRDGEFYSSRGVRGESDNEIRSLINQLIFDA